MTIRIRERRANPEKQGSFSISNTYNHEWDSHLTSSYEVDYQRTEDMVYKGVHNDYFRSEIFKNLSVPVTGEGYRYGDPNILASFDSWMPDLYSGSQIRTTRMLTPELSRSEQIRLFTEGCARLSPSAPETNLLVYLAELKEIPSLIRAAKDLLSFKKIARMPLKMISNSYLAYQFGLAPLVSDVKNLISIPKLVEKRRKDIEKLYSKGVLKKTTRVFEDDLPKGPIWAPGHSLRLWLPYEESWDLRQEMWVHVNYYLTKPPPPLGKQSKVLSTDQIKSLILGGNLSLDDIWELVPWSFLVDYFSSLGDYLSYTSNRLPGVSEDGCVMYKTIHTFKASPIDQPVQGVTFNDILATQVIKRRYRGELGITVDAGSFLTPGQCANILALLFSSKAGYTR